MTRRERARPERRIAAYGRARPGSDWGLSLLGALALLIALGGRSP